MDIHIPAPCHENWEKMLPAEQGRHCEVCSKTVIDFTNKQPSEIIRHIQENSSRKICGRFNKSQLTQPVKPLFYELAYTIIDNNFFSYAKKWLAIIALCFVFSNNADAQTIGKIKNTDTVRISTKPVLTGRIATVPSNIKTKPAHKNKKSLKNSNCEKPAEKKSRDIEQVIVMGMIIKR